MPAENVYFSFWRGAICVLFVGNWYHIGTTLGGHSHIVSNKYRFYGKLREWNLRTKRHMELQHTLSYRVFMNSRKTHHQRMKSSKISSNLSSIKVDDEMRDTWISNYSGYIPQNFFKMRFFWKVNFIKSTFSSSFIRNESSKNFQWIETFDNKSSWKYRKI